MDKLLYEKRTNLYLFLSILFEHDNVLFIHILKQVIQTRLERRSISLPQGEAAKIYLKTQQYKLPVHHFQSIPDPLDFINLILSIPSSNVISFSTLATNTNYIACLIMPSAGVSRVCLKGHSKHFQLQVIGPCGNYSDLPLWCTSSHRGYGKNG